MALSSSLVILFEKENKNRVALFPKLRMQHFIWLFPYPKKKENILIQVYEFFQWNQVRRKMRIIPLSTYEKSVTVIP